MRWLFHSQLKELKDVSRYSRFTDKGTKRKS